MSLQIEKRDGRKVAYNADKIENAMVKAYFSVRDKNDKNFHTLIDNVTSFIEKKIIENNVLSVESIQDIIEHKLMVSSYKDVAKAFITYRDQRSRERNRKSSFIKKVSEKIRAKNVQNQNANVDEKSFGGRMGEARSTLMVDYALQYCMSEMARNNHLNNEIYIHDLDSYAVGMHNCMSMPLDELLAKGFNTRQTDVRPAQSVNTAMQLVAVLFQLQSLQQFGGVSATHLDWTMVPYVRKSFKKHLKDGMKWIERLSDYKVERFDRWLEHDTENHPDGLIHFDDKDFKEHHPEAWEYAMYMTEKETVQAVEGLYHNLNTLQSRSGNQLPFTSINYGTCTLSEGRMVTKALLDISIKGIGKLNRTPIFPCGIFQYMKGVNDEEGTPNYDLFKLALKSTAKRLYPNYANVDWSGNTGYDINNPSTYFSTMGALAGHEHLYVRINDGDPIDISIKDFYELCNGNSSIKGRPMQLYYNKSEMNVPTNEYWRRNQNHGVNEVKEGSGVYKITYIPEDISYIGSSSNIQQRIREHKKCIKHKGGIDAGLNFEDTNVGNYIFEVIEYVSDYKQAEKKYINIIPNANFRGTSNKYYKNVGITRGRGFDTRPSIPMNPDVPQNFIDLNDLNIKVLDKGNVWVKVKHVFRNSEFNTPLMMHITYLENGKLYSLCCTEDHPLWTGTKFTKACELTLNDVLFRGDGMLLQIKEIKYYYDRRESYDIGTETGTFIGSDIIMHNCRTANGTDINQTDPKLKQLKDGRGNLCPVTIILPKIAMLAKQEVLEYEKQGLSIDLIKYFLDKLNIKIEEAKDMLIERYEWMCQQSPDSAKFMYENNVMYGYVPEEGIRSALKHGTLSVGQLGLAETLQILVGCDHTEKEGMKLAKQIEQLFKEKCLEYKNKYSLNFGVYYTPAENLCYTSMKKFKEEFGEILNVSDKDYFTNSMHVPVWKKISPFDKIDIESELTGYSSAGCITYVELDGSVNRNIDALEQIVKYAMDKDIPYFAVNVPSDLCLDCGYQGEINDECPQCHSKNIQQLRRVTGYLTGNYKTAFNSGKQQEVEMREKHANQITDLKEE